MLPVPFVSKVAEASGLDFGNATGQNTSAINCTVAGGGIAAFVTQHCEAGAPRAHGGPAVAVIVQDHPSEGNRSALSRENFR